jgi:hypothetical protein
MLAKRNLHQQFNVTKCGLIISSEFPEIAASPDALFHCKCHGMGVIEAKCSWKHRYFNIYNCYISPLFYIKSESHG